MLLGAGAILYSGAPGIAAQLGLGIGGDETPLRFADKPIERRDLASGSELFAVSGQGRQPDRRSASACPTSAPNCAMRRAGWSIAGRSRPKQRTLAPGGAIDFNCAKLDVPANAKRLELSFAQANARRADASYARTARRAAAPRRPCPMPEA